jgi:hypothetical protein
LRVFRKTERIPFPLKWFCECDVTTRLATPKSQGAEMGRERKKESLNWIKHFSKRRKRNIERWKEEKEIEINGQI